MEIQEGMRQRFLAFQKNEITEHHIYRELAGMVRSPENKRVLENIAEDELRHYQEWRRYTKQDVKPDTFRIRKQYLICRLFGFTFGAKLMEAGEHGAQVSYEQIGAAIPEAHAIVQEESAHEKALLELLDEELLRYTGSMVLGLNDALVELTGILAGLTLALRNTKLIAMTGAITGVAAALSMAIAAYLSTKTEQTAKKPLTASLYTGAAYVITVLVLIFPYLILQNYYICLGCALIGAILIIAVFNYYIAVAKDLPFRKRFLEMAGLSFAVAAISFLVGYALRTFMGINI